MGLDDDVAEDAIEGHRKSIEPWLSAVFQSEHLALLVGSGFTTAVSYACGATATGMGLATLKSEFGAAIAEYAIASAKACGRGSPNIEDQIRSALQLLGGLQIIKHTAAKQLEEEVQTIFTEFLNSLLETERDIQGKMESHGGDGDSHPSHLLVSFLLSFACRAASRERLQLFTTNYDRLIEFGCDLAGLRAIDRFVGALTPVFRSSRLEVDLHYSPPGIRGEPRYLEGVIHFSKLHGSIDWRWDGSQLRKMAVPFGAAKDHPDVVSSPATNTMIYPNPAKDIETLFYPYADLFRDLSCAVCRPNTSLVTYGYGFGDDHINRVIKDMLTIPSTHLVIVSFDLASGRITEFCKSVGRSAQISLLIGPHFGDLKTLVANYLPKPAIDPISWRRSNLLKRRGTVSGDPVPDAPPDEGESDDDTD